MVVKGEGEEPALISGHHKCNEMHYVTLTSPLLSKSSLPEGTTSEPLTLHSHSMSVPLPLASTSHLRMTSSVTFTHTTRNNGAMVGGTAERERERDRGGEREREGGVIIGMHYSTYRYA